MEDGKGCIPFLSNMAKSGQLNANKSFEVMYDCPLGQLFLPIICSMDNLVYLDLMSCEIGLDDITKLFESCPLLKEVHLKVQNSLLKVEVDVSSVSLNFYFYVHLVLIFLKNDRCRNWI